MTARPFPPPNSFHPLPPDLFWDLERKDENGNPFLDLADIGVYGLLKCHAQAKGLCHPSMGRLAKLSSRSVSTIKRSLARLDKAGHIQRKKHMKGKIFLLTDVAANGAIKRRARLSFIQERSLVPTAEAPSRSVAPTRQVYEINDEDPPL